MNLFCGLAEGEYRAFCDQTGEMSAVRADPPYADHGMPDDSHEHTEEIEHRWTAGITISPAEYSCQVQHLIGELTFITVS